MAEDHEPRAAVALVEAAQRVLLLRRPVCAADPWSDHWALPGGRREVGDANLLATARRECREEVGLDPGADGRALPWRWAGRRRGHGILVAPFHFRLAAVPPLVLAASEVASTAWLPLARLADPTHHRDGRVVLDGGRSHPHLLVEGHPLWGFTYAVLTTWRGPEGQQTVGPSE